MGKKKENVLCRRCYQLFRYDSVGALCQSWKCSQIPDDRGQERPRFLDPRAYGLWQTGRPPGLELTKPCPFCETRGRLVPACPVCRRPLDATVGQVGDQVIGVIGASDSGKSHFLATVLHQFLEARIGGEEWKIEFADREDRRVYQRQFLRPLFEQQRELDVTPASVGPELRLLLEHQNTGQRTLLVFRDLGGELFTSPERLDEVDFLRYSRGIVLITDPLAFEAREVEGVEPWPRSDRPTAIDILEIYREVLETRDRPPHLESFPLLPEEKFLAVAVTKADLVLAGDHSFWNEESSGRHLERGFWQDREDESRRVEEWIHRALGSELTQVADGFADVSYFFVSSFGYPHPPKTTPQHRPTPRRVHEPIFALLDRFVEGLPQGRRGRGRATVDTADEEEL